MKRCSNCGKGIVTQLYGRQSWEFTRICPVCHSGCVGKDSDLEDDGCHFHDYTDCCFCGLDYQKFMQQHIMQCKVELVQREP